LRWAFSYLQPSRTRIVMRQAVTTMVMGVSLALVLAGRARGDGADVAATVDRARRLIQANDHSSAITFLEEALVEANAKDRSAIVDLLRQSYEAMARQAEASGRSREAIHYRDNLAILNRSRDSSSPAKTPAEMTKSPLEPAKTPPQSKPVTKGGSAPDRAANEAGRFLPIKALLSDLASHSAQSINPEPEPASLPAPLDAPAQKPLSSERATLDSTARLGSSEPSRNESDREANASNGTSFPAAAVVSPSTESQPGSDATDTALEKADRLFRDERYDEAGRTYRALAGQNGLPANRKEHWAYCRWVDVVRRLNARPGTAREWEAIESEVESIQRLTPGSWYGDYLRSKVAETRGAKSLPAAQSSNLLVRAAAPDEAETRNAPRLFGKSRAAAPLQPSGSNSELGGAPKQSLDLPGPMESGQEPNLAAAAVGTDTGSVASKTGGRGQRALDSNVRRAGVESAAGGTWQVHETTNFRIFHHDTQLAEAAAEAAESVRTNQAKKWSSPAGQRAWTPRCEIYLYPTGELLAQATNQPHTSPGFSAMEVNGSRIVGRKIHLRADHAQLRAAILPHEVTHVVLADLFIAQPLPRWADEGIAVLAEPTTEQQLKAAELRGPLESGGFFPLDKLMAMDYPDAKDWGIYYAQSVSLTRFLVDQGPPGSLVRFVRASQRNGAEAALREVYQINGLDNLQQRWLDYARRQLATLGTATADANASR
jgi:hypothetical protein